MIAFFRARGAWLAAVVLIMSAISLAQGGISYTMAFGSLRGLLPQDPSAIATVLLVLRYGLVALMAALWAMARKRALFRVIIAVNALNTLALLVHTGGLIAVLSRGASEAVNTRASVARSGEYLPIWARSEHPRYSQFPTVPFFASVDAVLEKLEGVFMGGPIAHNDPDAIACISPTASERS